MAAAPGLDGGLLVRADHVLVIAERSPPSANSLSTTSPSTATPSRSRSAPRRSFSPHRWDGLVRELVATRRGQAKIGTPDDVPWLFPGGHPGRPLTAGQIGKRRHRIGVRPEQDRSTALFALATEVPAAIRARMLGVHIKVAVQWQQASAGDGAAYAADVSNRNAPHQPIHEPGATP
ncbi:hypothetical protein [Streptomyces sp. NPDC048516]|uniref:hypothetical protein n=1 Tax=Streptomyces sp. NPDC048516 TaxID=3365565 RepID=UPI0037173455